MIQTAMKYFKSIMGRVAVDRVGNRLARERTSNAVGACLAVYAISFLATVSENHIAAAQPAPNGGRTPTNLQACLAELGGARDSLENERELRLAAVGENDEPPSCPAESDPPSSNNVLAARDALERSLRALDQGLSNLKQRRSP